MATMALRYGLRRCAAAKSLKASSSPVIRGSTNLTRGTTTISVPADTRRRFELSLSMFQNFISGFPKFVMADEPPPPDEATMRLKDKYFGQYYATRGFGIDVDLGDGYIRPFHGSLDDPKVTGPARFAVDTYNSGEGEHLQFLRVIKANCGGKSYYLTFEAFDGTGKRRIYRALVDCDERNERTLVCFEFFGDADGPTEQYVTKVVYKMKEQYGGAFLSGDVIFDPKTMVYEEHIYPRDHLKYMEQLHASEGFDVEDLDLGFSSGIRPISEPQNDPDVLSCANFAVEEYNKQENKQLHLVKLVKANHRVVNGVYYYLTLEVAGDAKNMVYRVLVRCRPEPGSDWTRYLCDFSPVENGVNIVMPLS